MESDREKDDREAREAMAVSVGSMGIAALRLQQALVRVLMAKDLLSADDAAVVYQYAADNCTDNPAKPELTNRMVSAAKDILLDLGEEILKEASQPKN